MVNFSLKGPDVINSNGKRKVSRFYKGQFPESSFNDWMKQSKHRASLDKSRKNKEKNINFLRSALKIKRKVKLLEKIN